MALEDFVAALKAERDAMVAGHAATPPRTEAGALLEQAQLSASQRPLVMAALDAAVTDAFYTILLGLDGAASLGGTQQSYRLHDETGACLSEGNGELEAAAFETFQASREPMTPQ